jgi:hypothetical protein
MRKLDEFSLFNGVEARQISGVHWLVKPSGPPMAETPAQGNAFIGFLHFPEQFP